MTSAPQPGGSTTDPSTISVQGMNPETLRDMYLRYKTDFTAFFGGFRDADIDKTNPFSRFIPNAGTRPEDVEAVVLKTRTGKLHLPAGFYLLTAGTGGGKSITSAALVLTALNQSKFAQYCYCNEARTPTLNNPFGPGEEAYAFETTEDSKSKLMNWPTARLAPYLKDMRKETKDPAIIVIDSIALPLRSYKGQLRAGQSTMQGGMQPMDIEFVVVCEAIAVKENAVVIGIINDELVPFGTKLEGMAEGVILVHSAGKMSVRTRYNRRFEEHTLSPQAVSAGAKFLRYADWKDASDTEIFGLRTESTNQQT